MSERIKRKVVQAGALEQEFWDALYAIINAVEKFNRVRAKLDKAAELKRSK